LDIRCIWIAILLGILVIIPLSSCTPVPVKPAEFKVNRITVSPTEADPSQTITITAEIGNIGEVSDNYSAIIFLDGVPYDTKDVQLGPSENKTVEFQIIVKSPGQHEVSIDSEKKYFTVNEIKITPQGTTNSVVKGDINIPPSGLINAPNPYVEIKITDFFYYTESDTANCQMYCTITNKHDKWQMKNVTVRGVLLFSFINPGERDTIAKSIPCRGKGTLYYNEFSWEWAQK
jgi:hypothetical protein